MFGPFFLEEDSTTMSSKIFLRALLAMLAMAVSACSDDEGASPNASDLRDLDGTCLFDDFGDSEVQPPLSPLITVEDVGLYASDFTWHADSAYVVDYSRNAVHRIDLNRHALSKNYIDLGQDAGPYSVYADDEAVYVTCQGIVQVVKVTHAGGQKTTVLDGSRVKAPVDVVTHEGTTFVADSEYDYADASRTGGMIYAVTAEGDVISHKTTSPNPAFLHIVGGGSESFLVSVNAGVVSFSATSDPTPPDKSCIDVWNIRDFIEQAEVSPRTFCVTGASLGRPALVGEELVLGDALQPSLYAISLDDLKSASSSDAVLRKIPVAASRNTVMTPVSVQGNLAAVDYNGQAFVWFEDGTPISFLLTKSEAAPMGPIDVLYDDVRKQVLILKSAAGSVSIFEVRR